MRTRKKRSSRVLALLLSVMMVATSLSQTVIAEEISVNTPESTTSELSEAEKATPTAEPTEAPEASERPLQEVSPEPSPTVSAEPSAVPTEDLQVGQKARSARAEVITVTINGGAAVGGDSLQVVVEANGGATSVTSLKITAGNVTVDDWKYLKSLSALAIFEIDAAVTEVANIPDDLALSTTLTSVIVPQAITIGNYTFYECTELTSVSFPKATSIGENAFYGCSGLTGASFPAATSIGDSAFNACTELTSVSLPAATSIGNMAFYSCTKLATLKLGATPPAAVGADAFTNCHATRALSYVDASGNALTGDVLRTAQAAYKAFNDGDTTDNNWYGWTVAQAITATINGSIIAAGGETLQAVVESNGDATNVTELKITDGKVTEDDWNYLKNLTAMTTFEIDSSVTVADMPVIMGGIFPTNIITVTVPHAITICAGAFENCTALTAVSLPAAKKIGAGAFYNCAALTAVSLPAVTSIGENAFYRCPALKSASFPAVTSIAFNAFAGCTAITTLNLGATPPTTIGYNAFKDCPATRILGYMNADGTALTGDALTAAQAAYKAIGDGNTTDLLWYGWTIGTATPTATPTTSPTATPTGKIKLDLPKLQNGRYVYTGSAIEVQLAGFDGDLMTIMGNSATEIGNYKVVIGLKDTDKYEWNTDINKYGSWEFTWEIVKTAATPAPTIDPSAKPTAVPTATSSAVPSPKTGDSNDNLFIWVFLMVAAFSVIVIICVRIIKKRSDYNGRHGA